MTIVDPTTVSISTLEFWEQLGPWTAADVANAYVLLKLCDSIGSLHDQTEQYIRDDDTHIGWGQLLDVNTCPYDLLPWLAQFNGVVLPIGMADTAARALIVAAPNYDRGTPASIIAAAKQYLTGAQRVDLFERVAFGSTWQAMTQSWAFYTFAWNALQSEIPDAYGFKVVTYTSEMPTGAHDLIEAAMLAVKPAGLKMLYVVQSGPNWTQETGTWAALTVTWASLSSEVP